MSSTPSPDQLKEMVKNFRCGELQTLLSYAGQQKSGKKAELVTRVERIIIDPNRPAIFVNKVQELYSKYCTNRPPHNGFQSSSTPQSNSGNGYSELNGAIASLASSGTTIRINGFSIGSQSASASAASALGSNSPSPSNNSSTQSHHHHHHHHRSPSPPAPPPLTAFGTKNSMMTLSQALSSASAYTPQYNSYATNSATASTPRNKYTPADVRFRPLAFYDLLETILPPTALVAETHSRTQQSMFTFSLSAAQVGRIRASTSGHPPDYSVQVQLRFCKYARESRGTADVDDYLPSGLVVKLNSRIVPLPAPLPTSKPNAEPKRPPRPLDLTEQCKLSYGEETGFLVIDWNQWAEGEDPTRRLPFALTVQLVHRINSSELLKRLNQNSRKSIEYTQKFINAKFKSFQDADVAIASEKIRIALRCPLSRSCIDVPIRSSNCDHVQVYDAMSYLSMNEKKPTWLCPVCDRSAPYSTLYIDSMIERIIHETCTATGSDSGDLNPAELFFLPDLSWTTKNGSAEQVDLADSDDEDDAPPTPRDVKPTLAALQAALTPEKASSSNSLPVPATNSFSPASTCSTSSSCIMTLPESRSNSVTGHRPSSSLAQPSNINASPRANAPQQPSSSSSSARPVVVDLTLSDSDSEPPNKVARGSSSASVPLQQQSDYAPSSGTSRFTNSTNSSTVPKSSAAQQSSIKTCLHSIDALLAGDEVCSGHDSDSGDSEELPPPKARTVNRKSHTKKRRGRAKTRVPSDSSEDEEEEEEDMQELRKSDTDSDTSKTSTASSASTPETTPAKRKRVRQPAKATGRGRGKRKLAVESESDWSLGRDERVDDIFAGRKSKRIADRPPASKAVGPSSGSSSLESESDSDVPLALTQKNSRAKATSSPSSSTVTVSPTASRNSAPRNTNSPIPFLASVADSIPSLASVTVLHPDPNRTILKLKLTPSLSPATAKVVDPNSQSATTPSYTARSGADVMRSEDSASRVQQSSSSSNSKTQFSFPDWNKLRQPESQSSSPDWGILRQQPQYDIASFYRTQDAISPVSPALPPHEPSPSLTQSSAFQSPSSEERNNAQPLMPPPPPPLLSANQYNASSPTSPFSRSSGTGGTGTPSPPTNQLPPLPPLVSQYNAGAQLLSTYPGASSSSNYAGGFQAGMTNSYPSFASQNSDNRWSNGASGFGGGGRVPPMRFPNMPSLLDQFMTPSSPSSISDLMNRAGSYGYSSSAPSYGGYMQPNPANVAHPAFAPKPRASSPNSYHSANSNFANLYPQPSTYQNNGNFPH